MAGFRDGGSVEEEYDRLFDALAELAEDLDIPLDEAEGLINDVLLSTLVKRNITDIDTWVAAAFTSAVSQRGGRVS
ncbi:MAG TPA: hypothetical protein VF432_21910 [Thermoanaerobaculia bacterium]